MDIKNRGTISPNALAFFASDPHQCSYLEDRQALTVFADPYIPMNNSVYSKITEYGFRRSGEYVYAPQCPGCEACISVRIPVKNYRPNRKQQRVLKRNADLTVKRKRPAFHSDQFKLYEKYISRRHSGGGMDNPSPEDYLKFLTSSWSNTWFYEFKIEDELVAVAVVDQLLTGFSAVYTYYDPDLSATRSLGHYAILHLIQEAQNLSLQWLYLGYYIQESQKMRYKSEYRPIQAFISGQWRLFPKNKIISR